MSTGLGGAAARLADRGLAVLPCHEPTPSGCSCRQPDCASPGKHPRTRRGLHDASSDPAVVAGWWRRWPAASVGVRAGAVSSLVVLDIDRQSGGFESLIDLQRRHGALPPTLTVVTGGGGRHYWFAHPGGTVRNSAGRLGAGIDIRADGGYVIAPPSLHTSGASYRWALRRPLAPLPGWILDLAREPAAPSPRRPAALSLPGNLPPWARAALAREVARVQRAAPGSRNDTLNRAAFSLGQLVGAGHLDDGIVRGALVAAGLDAGLGPREVDGTVASGLRAGLRRPRHPSRSPLAREWGDPIA